MNDISNTQFSKEEIEAGLRFLELLQKASFVQSQISGAMDNLETFTHGESPHEPKDADEYHLCRNCKYFDIHAEDLKDEHARFIDGYGGIGRTQYSHHAYHGIEHNVITGICRKNPPVPAFPKVQEIGWCGHWEKKDAGPSTNGSGRQSD